MKQLKLFLLTATLPLFACGQLPSSEKKAVDPALLASTSSSQMSQEAFEKECFNISGKLYSNNSICAEVKSFKAIPQASTSQFTYLDIADVIAGSSIYVSGNVQASSVELYLNTTKIGNAPTTTALRAQTDGKLRALLQPGATYSNVTAYVYHCYNRNMQLVACPF